MPPTGVEPAHPPPEGGALSTELRGHIFGCAGRLVDLEQFDKPPKGISERIWAYGKFADPVKRESLWRV